MADGERNGNPLQCSCLENPMDRGTWLATVHGVTKSWTWLSDWAHIGTLALRGTGPTVIKPETWYFKRHSDCLYSSTWPHAWCPQKEQNALTIFNMVPRDGHHNRILNYHSSNQRWIGSTSFTHSIAQAKRVGDDEAGRLSGDWVQRIILHTLKKKERKYPNHSDSTACNYVCVCFKIMPPKFLQNNHLATWRLHKTTGVSDRCLVSSVCPWNSLWLIHQHHCDAGCWLLYISASPSCVPMPHHGSKKLNTRGREHGENNPTPSSSGPGQPASSPPHGRRWAARKSGGGGLLKPEQVLGVKNHNA